MMRHFLIVLVIGIGPAKLIAQIAPLDRAMKDFVEKKRISGGVTLVLHNGKVVHHEAIGLADINDKRLMRKDSMFAIASMTKPIAAMALMKLHDEGSFRIDHPVSKYIPSFKGVKLKGQPPNRPITIRDLLTHTSGLGRPNWRKMKGTESLQELADVIAGLPMRNQPGERWQYGDGVLLSGRIIEVISGQSFESFLHENIFMPLDMKDTTFRPTDDQWKRVARVYRPTKDKKGIEEGQSRAHDPSTTKTRMANPSGGLFSTARDMGRFYQMVLNGGELDGQRVVSAKAVKLMTTLHTGDLKTGFTPGNGWGLGWCIVRQPQGVTKMLSVGTYGHGGAFHTQGWVDPKRKMIFVLMIQRMNFGNGDGSEVRGAFQQIVVDELTRKEKAADALRATGGRVFAKNGVIYNVDLNRTKVADDELEHLVALTDLTDLSMEQTKVTDAGIVHVSKLKNLEWLNLFQTKVGDGALQHISGLKRLQHLPVGETKVTDAGLSHLADMVQLQYLGLRANAITDNGIVHLRKLTGLRGLHLGETKITDAGVERLHHLARLKKLWLHDTAVTDKSILHLSKLRALELLVIHNTKISNTGIAKLQASLPRCRVQFKSE